MDMHQPLNRPLTLTVNMISELTTVNTDNKGLKCLKPKGQDVIGNC
jgi:hypothetical protein